MWDFSSADFKVRKVRTKPKLLTLLCMSSSTWICNSIRNPSLCYHFTFLCSKPRFVEHQKKKDSVCWSQSRFIKSLHWRNKTDKLAKNPTNKRNSVILFTRKCFGNHITGRHLLISVLLPIVVMYRCMEIPCNYIHIII